MERIRQGHSFRMLVLFGIAGLAIPATCQGQGRKTAVVDASAASGSLPSITPGGVISAGSFGAFTSAAPGSWIEIYGTSLAADTRLWTSADFNGVNAPTSIDNTTVTIGGQSAFIYYVSPTQVNAQVPSNVGTGPQPVVVSTAVGASDPVTITINQLEPGLLAPPSFKVGGTQYVVALFPDGATYVLPPGAIPGVNSRRAQPGDIVTMYGIGFGSVTPDSPAGQIVPGKNTLQLPFQLQFGQAQPTINYDGLAPGAVGLYQFNVVVPNILSSDAVPLTFSVGYPPSLGAAGTQTLYIAVQNNTPPPQLQSLTLYPNSVVGGGSASGFLNLTEAAPAGGAVVSLSSDSTAVSVPASVTVPAGFTSTAFNIFTNPVNALQTATISATYNGSSAQAQLTVRTNVPAPTVDTLNTSIGQAGSTLTLVANGANLSTVTSVQFSPSTGITVSNVNATATQVTATVTIAANAPAGEADVTLSSPTAGPSESTTFYVVQPPAGQGTYDGLWEGTTALGLPMSMIISGNSIKAWAYNLDLKFGGCTTEQTTVTTNTSIPITGGSFSGSTFVGTFQSLTNASGIVNWAANIPNCGSGYGTFTWTAAKQ
ncbi:MAG: IPT/TIG domain-containing protein [Bryobacteraceae bacterium]